MKRLNDVHMQLLELADHKRHALVHNLVEELNKIVNQESKLVRQAAELEAKRVSEVDAYLMKRGFRPDTRVTVTDLIKIMIRADEKRALQEAQGNLLKTLSQLKEKNELNQQLIKHSLAFINYSYDLLLGPPEEEMIYQRPESHGVPKRSGLFDTRA
jgi:flagellar biosynthesis/type III secretory pathway chaperone